MAPESAGPAQPETEGQRTAPEGPPTRGGGTRWRPDWRHPVTVPLLAAGYLALAYLAVVVVDILQWGGVQAWLGSRTDQPLLWYHLFREKNVTEAVQWTVLGALAVTAALTAGRLRREGHTAPARFWVLIAITGAVLAIEDAASLRIVIAWYTIRILDVPQDPYHYYTEGVYYALIASIPVYALLRYWRVHWHAPSRWWLLSGYGLYGLAASMSVTRYFGYWYKNVGDRIVAWLGPGMSEGFNPRRSDPGTGHWFMDMVVEESMELMAAAALVAAVFAYARWHGKRHPPEEPVDRGGVVSPGNEATTRR